MKGVTQYRGLTKIYFFYLLKSIIKIGNLEKRDVKVLDFGCGLNKLKSILGCKVTGFDVISELSDIDDWQEIDFDIFVANQVFYTFREKELEILLRSLKKKNNNLELIICMSNQGLLNNLGKVIFNRAEAHRGTKLKPSEEKKVLLKFCNVISEKNIMSLSSLLRLKFK